MFVVIGSQALKLRYENLLDRDPVDYDVVGTLGEINEWAMNNEPPAFYPISDGKKYFSISTDKKPIEFDIAWKNSKNAYSRTTFDFLTKVIEDKGTRLYELPEFGNVLVPDLDVLYMLKMSHRYLKNSPAFLKTMNDIHKMREVGAKIPERWKGWYKARRDATYNYKHPSLMRNKDEFFNPEEVEYTYDHDSIHRAVALENVPAYTLFQRDDHDVAVSKEKFYNLPYRIQLNSVLEESYVLALERSQIPFPGKLTPKESFLIALMKVCTSITSGWWREFAWENYHQALEDYSDEYIKRFKQGLTNGTVQGV